MTSLASASTADDPKWQAAIQLHRQAADHFVATADAVSDAQWQAPRPGDKWSPAILVDHLERTYDVVLRELAGGDGMAIKTPRLFRFVARFLIVPRILRGTGFPRRARAPRETRPNKTLPDRQTAMGAFRAKAGAVESAMLQKRREAPETKLTHAYFGPAPLTHSLMMVARHIEHHQRQLAELDAAWFDRPRRQTVELAELTIRAKR